jgi:hypothetical protein
MLFGTLSSNGTNESIHVTVSNVTKVMDLRLVEKDAGGYGMNGRVTPSRVKELFDLQTDNFNKTQH